MIDLNCDLGEGAGHDAELLELCTTANVCCGAHAGDPMTSRATMEWAAGRGVAVGAHPGYPDRESFGRREMTFAEDDLFDELRRQVEFLQSLAPDIPLRHIKPHGALYNQACRDPAVARPVVRLAAELGLPILALPNSELEQQSAGRVQFIREGFADRGYRPDGQLVPRTEPGAFIHDPAEAARQVEWLVNDRGVQSICVHGDGPGALEFLRQLKSGLAGKGYEFGSVT
ncbi:MAG: LamB/YcsF family protein [Gemmataceae bacterium]|nr:LamB/YcsF family protein [Gemmataceae bacterium]